MEDKYSGYDNKYFNDFIDYKIASVELSATSVNKSELFKKYLYKKPILYSHWEYMNFFNQFFDHYLTTRNKCFGEEEIENIVNYQKSFAALMDTLGKDTLLFSESLRELVALKGLKELYNSPYYLQQNILDILSQVSATSHFTIHKLIAANLTSCLTKLQKGTIAPDFRLISLEGDFISLTDFYGKPIYLSFLVTWTNACLAEFEIMDSLYSIWGNKINFITVSLDNNKEVITRYKNEKHLKWTFLYNGTGYDLLEAYGIKTFPLFVLISPEGKIMQCPAYKPSEGIGDTFDPIQQKSKD